MLSPLALLAATLCLMISLVGMAHADGRPIDQDGRPVYLESGRTYMINGDVTVGDHITCAFDPTSGKLGFDRIFRVPAAQSWKHLTLLPIGTFTVPDAGSYAITCQSRTGSVDRVQIDLPGPRWLRAVEICGGALGVFGVVWVAYVCLRRRYENHWGAAVFAGA
ncbi:hypothetical protein ACFXPS_43750 [Nocardia sp. NPDC059091]|uniref:hypothetical protein n=1 Tax=unclassified Nocardia TaxID=2637762 RepID=UPI003691E2E2